MPDVKQHVMERRSHMIAQRLRQRITDMATALQSQDGRIPFRTKLSRNDALDWWTKHRYDGLGAKALAGLDPLTVAKLDNALNEHSKTQADQGLPVEANVPTETGAALQQEEPNAPQ